MTRQEEIAAQILAQAQCPEELADTIAAELERLHARCDDLAVQVAGLKAARPGREVVAQAVGELGERIASASVAPPSVVGEVVEAARAYLISTRTSADTRIKREFKAALSRLDSAPRYGVEEIAREIADHVGAPPMMDAAIAREWEAGVDNAARAVLSLLASGVPADERARIRNDRGSDDR